MKRLLFISNLYPNPSEEHRAAYNRQQIKALSRKFAIDVVSPVAWTTRLRKANFFKIQSSGNIRSCYPAYFYTPRILRGYYGHFYLYSIYPYVSKLVKENSYFAIFGSWLYPDGWASAVLAKKLKLPLFLKVHGTDVNRLQPRTPIATKSIWAASQAVKVFCVSSALRTCLADLGVPEKNLQVAYNGIDKQVFFGIPRDKARQELKIFNKDPLVLFVGNIKKTKGPKELIVAFRKLLENQQFSEAKLHIIGTGPFERELKKRVFSFGLQKRVIFAGSQSSAKINTWMNAADLLCLPSYMEGVPNVILEALTAGTKVVASAVGGIPELAEKDDRIFLCKEKDSEDLLRSMNEALTKKNIGDKRIAIGSWEDNAKLVTLAMQK